MESTPAPREDPQDLIRLIEWEIKRLEDAKKEQGWSPWMLYVALAGLLWKSVDEFIQIHSWVHVGLYWAAFTLLANFGSDLIRVLQARPRSKLAAPCFFSANRLLGGTRPYLLFVATKITGSAVVVLLASPLVGWQKAVWAVMFGFHFIGWFVMLTISFFDIPMLVSTDRAHIAVRGGIGIAYVLNIAAMAVMCLVLWPTVTSPFSATDLKFGLLLFAGSEIVSLLLSHHIVNPIRDNLVQLRRAISLGELGYVDAKARLDLALHGAEITKYLQPWVQSFLSSLDEVTREQDVARRSIEETMATLKAEPSPESSKAVAACLDKTKVHVKAVTRSIKRVGQAADAFNLRVGSVEASDIRIADEVRPLRESMKQQLDAAIEKSRRNEQAFESLSRSHEEFERRLPPEPRRDQPII